MTKKKRYEALSLQRCANVCYYCALVLAAVFVYSFFANAGYAVDVFTRTVQDDHYRFVHSGRWNIFGGAVDFLIMGALSITKANKRL